YQDEESPGRRLQEMATRGHGTLKLGKEVVDVQCQLGTYALSAHADEAQLVSLTETLDPAAVFLVHGDEGARESMGKALRERGRRAEMPRAGQSFEFNFRPSPTARRRPAIGRDRPLDLYDLWREIAGPGGNYFTLSELARTWWGEESRVDELRAALEQDVAYFVLDARGLVRARTREQIEQRERRRVQLAALQPGTEVNLRQADGSRRAARVIRVEGEYFFVEGDDAPHDPEELAAGLPESAKPDAVKVKEPNAALAFAREQFPPAARLRRTGYRLEQHVLILTFDFPDAAREQFADALARVESESGWKIEVDPEANQAALAGLAREVLPDGWEIVKGPSIHRQDRRVTLTVRGAGDPAPALERFRQVSGYGLDLAVAGPASKVEPLPLSPEQGERVVMEINAALGLIRAGLAGSTLYRTGLKGDAIVLGFISPQVGERHREQIERLAQTVGWKLAIHPQPNQNAILEIAQRYIARAGWMPTHSPSIHTDRGEVRVKLADAPGEDTRAAVAAEFETQTGYHLVVETGAATGKPVERREEFVSVPIARIRVTRHQESLALDPQKQQKVVEQLQRLGRVNKPVRVKRVAEGYVLLDGLYRLRAAQALGWERIAATVEE
ncbi:MAG TPA: MBL fold metallo-hydrolase RNA specificity domain-containing protein, partial [Anaerolineae bacterium]